MMAQGDEGAKRIRTADRMNTQQQTFKDLDVALKTEIKSVRLPDGGFEDTLDVTGLWNKIRKIEAKLDAGKTPTGELTKSIIALRRDPERLKIFKEGLEEISKYTPEKLVITGMIDKGMKMAGEAVNIGVITNLLSTRPGQAILAKIVKNTKGRINIPLLATAGAAVRPAITGILPQDDPVIQKTNQKLGEFRDVVKRATGGQPATTQ